MALNSKGQPVNSSWQVMTPGWAGKTAQTTWVTQYWVAVTANNSWYSSSQLSTIQWKAASWWWSSWWSSDASNSWSQANGNWGGNWNSNNNSSLWWTYLSSNPFSSPVTQKFQDINGNSRWSEAEADKARLDFELVRLLKCGEAYKAGIMFHPDSPYFKVCADVVVKYPKVEDVVNANRRN